MGAAFRKIFAASVGCLIAFQAPVAAQTIESPYAYLERRQEAGIWGGVLSSDAGRFGYAPSGGPVYGVRYGIELSGPIGFEGAAGLVDSKRDVVDPGRLEGDRVIGSADTQLAVIDARLRFSFAGRRSWHRISPFFTAGGGIVFSPTGRDPLDETLLAEDVFSFGTSFYGTFGLGTRWFVTDRIALRGDGIFSLWKVGTPPGYSDPDRAFAQVEDSEWLRGSAVNLSLVWRW